MHVDHEVLVDIAQAGHGASGDHVQDHLLGGAGLHARGAGDDLGAYLGNDGNFGGCSQRSFLVAGDGCGVRAAGTGISHSRHHVGGAA